MVTRNAGRTVNGIPRQALELAENSLLRLDGLVETPLTLTPEQILALPHEPYLGTLSCVQNGQVPETDWSGVRLSAVIALANPLPAARYARVSAGPYGAPVSFEQADFVLLCDALSGEPLQVDRGGPWRLVVPTGKYFTSVKWVDRIEVTADEPDDSATRIALARERARQSQRRKQGEG